LAAPDDPSQCPCCRQALPQSPELIVDESGILVRNGRFAALTRHEFALFETLQNAGHRILSREALLRSIYGLQIEEPEIKIIDVFVCKLRKKLKPLGVEIQAVWGSGYRLLPVAGGNPA